MTTSKYISMSLGVLAWLVGLLGLFAGESFELCTSGALLSLLGLALIFWNTTP